MSVYKRTFKYVKPYMPRFINALFCMIGIGLLTSFLMWLIKPVMNDIFASKKINMIIPIAVLIITASFFKGIFMYIQSYLMSFIGHKVVMDIRNELFTHLSVLSMDFYSRNPTGKLMARVTNDITLIQNSVTNVPANIVRDGVTIIALSGLAFYLNWRLAILAFFIFPIAIIPIVKFGRKLRNVSKTSQKQMAVLYNLIYENIFGIKVIKAFGLKRQRNQIFKRENESYFSINMRSMRVVSMTNPIMEFIGAIGITSIIVIGGFQVVHTNLTQGDFFAFIGCIVSLYSPIKNISNLNNVMQQSMAASSRVFKILDEKPKVMSKPDAIILERLNNEIVFNNVNFSYNENPILHNINFKVKKGELVALVGPSGSGKSTIINLLPRFYDVLSGRVMIDNKDLRDVKLSSLRGQISIVSQDTVLFNDTIENNIKMGNKEASFNDVVNASLASNAHMFIEKLRDGYKSKISDHGSNFSGGEKQRIALARAIIKNPSILLLDEATSALDSESERFVQEALSHLIEKRTITTLVVAHRLSTIRKADKVLVIDNGEIVESGNHESLIKANGLYAKLHKIQFNV